MTGSAFKFPLAPFTFAGYFREILVQERISRWNRIRAKFIELCSASERRQSAKALALRYSLNEWLVRRVKQESSSKAKLLQRKPACERQSGSKRKIPCCGVVVIMELVASRHFLESTSFPQRNRGDDLDALARTVAHEREAIYGNVPYGNLA